MKNNILKGAVFGTRLGCSMILLYAGLAKILTMNEFLQGFPLRNYLPYPVIILSAALLISVELCIALDSLTDDSFKEARVFLLGIYLFFFLIAMLRQVPIFNEVFFSKGCNCFSSNSEQDDKITHLARNTIFLCMALIAYIGSLRLQSPKNQKTV
jgi:ABC-type polysaccharide transport system permease subunit